MVTHIHPDHYGLAGRIREASGAWISLHPADAELIHDRYDEPDGLLERVAAALRRMGAPAEELATLRNAAMPVLPLVDPVVPDLLLEDGAQPEVPGWDLTAIWTPGHSPGHLCFYESGQRTHALGRPCPARASPRTSRSIPRPAPTPWVTTWRRSTSSSPTRSTRCCPPTSTASTTCTPGSRSSASTTGIASAR